MLCTIGDDFSMELFGQMFKTGVNNGGKLCVSFVVCCSSRGVQEEQDDDGDVGSGGAANLLLLRTQEVAFLLQRQRAPTKVAPARPDTLYCATVLARTRSKCNGTRSSTSSTRKTNSCLLEQERLFFTQDLDAKMIAPAALSFY
jgi:hypothetical protein